MKWGKRLRREVERSLPEWKTQFISYKQLKKQLNMMDPRSKGKMCRKRSRFAIGEFFDVNSIRESPGFTQLLDNELDKVNTFYVDKEEDYIIRIKELQIRVTNLNCKEEKLRLQKDILDFHAEMVLLLHYSVLNFTGLIKIVKKHNKKTGTSFQFSFMPRVVMQQPFFSTDLLFKLMRDCEAMLHSLHLEP